MEAIVVDSLCRDYGSHRVVDSLSFKVIKGRIHGFLGPNGAGKTTTMKMIAGVIPPTFGQIKVMGLDPSQNLHEIKSKIGVLLEHPPLFMDMEVREYLNYVCKLHRVDKKLIEAYVNDALDKLDLTSVQNRIIGNLSKGYKQRVGVAQAICFKPEIIILDEPTVGLDPKAVIEMREMIKSLGQDHTVLISSHLLHEISLICDDITIINEGKLKITGRLTDILSSISTYQMISLEVKGDIHDFSTQLKNLDFINEVKIEKNQDLNHFEIKVDINSDYRSIISRLVFENRLELYSLTSQTIDLEQAFLNYTGGENG